MKRLILVCLLGFAAAAVAQTPPDTASPQQRAGKNALIADLEKDDPKLHAQLEEARRRLDEAARQVAELSLQLGGLEGDNFVFMHPGAMGPQRAVLGVQIDPESGKEGARVKEVSPGSAAAEAGLASGDVIVSLDGKAIAGSEKPGRAVVDYMRDVKPEQKVKVKVLRAGKNKEFVVTPRPMPMMAGRRTFNIRTPDGASASIVAGVPEIHQFRHILHGDFGGMELASISPKLGAYFGANEGVLVVKAPDDAAFKLEDGDVIQTIDGRKPADGAHAMRILRSYKSGEKLNLQVLRQRKAVTLAVTMPDRPEWNEDFMMPAIPPAPAIAPVPPMAPVPAPARVPGGAATID
jgi:C-terminal processing protease CtpA/Prc